MTTDASAHYLVERVRETLSNDHRVMELGLQVSISGQKAVISGTVSTPTRRDAVTEVASEVLDGYEVVNQTVVASDVETEEVEELT